MLPNWTRRLAGRRAWLAGAAALGVVAVASWPGFSAGDLGPSRHRGSPLASGDPTMNHTDLYAFVSPDRPETVTLIATWLRPDRGPGFATDARYDIHVDNDGDGGADLSYRWTFRNSGPARAQRYTLTAIGPRGSTVLVPGGTVASSQDKDRQRAAAIVQIPGGQAFAGHADDPSFFDERIFDTLYGEPPAGTGRDALAGRNVQVVALQVPKKALALRADPGRNPVVGVWSTTAKRTLTLTRGGPGGDVVQVSRLGNPLFTDMVGATDLADTFRRATPAQDSRHAALLERVAAPPTARHVAASYRLTPPPTPRHDLAQLFLTGFGTPGTPARAGLNAHVRNSDADQAAIRPAEELRLNMAVPVTSAPHRLGLLAGDRQGFPNGRRLGDDVVDIELHALAGAWSAGSAGAPVVALAAGDRVDTNDTAFGPRFPYVAPPHTAPDPAAPADSGDAAGAVPAGDGWWALAAGMAAVALLAGGLVASRRYGRAAPGRYAVSR